MVAPAIEVPPVALSVPLTVKFWVALAVVGALALSVVGWLIAVIVTLAGALSR